MLICHLENSSTKEILWTIVLQEDGRLYINHQHSFITTDDAISAIKSYIKYPLSKCDFILDFEIQGAQNA